MLSSGVWIGSAMLWRRVWLVVLTKGAAEKWAAEDESSQDAPEYYDDGIKLWYEELLRAEEYQQTRLDRISTRASALIAASLAVLAIPAAVSEEGPAWFQVALCLASIAFAVFADWPTGRRIPDITKQRESMQRRHIVESIDSLGAYRKEAIEKCESQIKWKHIATGGSFVCFLALVFIALMWH